MNICEGLICKNPTDIFLSESVSITRLMHTLTDGDKVVKAILNIMLTDLVLFVNVGKSMDSEQIAQTRELILEEFSHLKPEDFKLCFTRAKKGHYGQLYDRIDGQLILTWVGMYDTERAGAIEEVMTNENKQLKKELGTPLVLDKNAPEFESNYIFKSNMLKLLKQLEDNKKQRETSKIEDKIQVEQAKDPVWQMHQNWLKQYDAIWKRQNYPRLIRRYGKMLNPFYNPDKPKPGVYKMILRRLDKSEFLEHKQWQYNAFVVLGRKPYEVREEVI